MSHKHSVETQKKLKSLYNKTKYSYCSGAYYDEDKGIYIKYSCHSPWLKTRSRKITRTRQKRDFDNINYKGCRYKKYFDYWWELF